MIPTIAKGRKWQVFVEVKVLLDFDILRFFLSFLAMKGNPFILLAPMRKHLFLGNPFYNTEELQDQNW